MHILMMKKLVIALLACVMVGCVPNGELQFDPTQTPSYFPTSMSDSENLKTPSIGKTPEIVQFSMATNPVIVKPIEESVIIRSDPGTNFEAIGILSDGKIASVIGKTWNVDWLQISVSNLPG